MVGIEVGAMVGEVVPSSQSRAAPGSKGGVHFVGWNVVVGTALGGTVLG